MSLAERHYAARGWVLAGLFAGLAWSRHASDRELRPEALWVVALGALFRFWAGRYIAVHSNGTRLGGETLSTGGPYAWGRHPLYLSNVAIAAGLLGFANSLSLGAAASFLGLVIGHHLLLAMTEERYLAGRFGTDYRRYREGTPLFAGFRRFRGGLDAGPKMGEGLQMAWRRQAANLAKTAACAGLLWSLA